MNIFKWFKKENKSAKANKPNPYSVKHKFQWYICCESNPGTLYSYSIKREIVEPETYNSIFTVPFRFAISELYDKNYNIKYVVNILFVNDNIQNDWPTGYASARLWNNTIEYCNPTGCSDASPQLNSHKTFTEVVEIMSNINEDILNLILKDILVQLNDNNFENIVKSVENAFLLLTRNFIPERYMKALEDDFSTEKLNNEVIESITECVENGGLYYNPCGPMIVSEFPIEDISRNIEHVLKDKLSDRMVDDMDKFYVIFKEE